MPKRKKEKEVKNPSKHIFKSIYVFSYLEFGKSGEFLPAVSDLGNALVAKNINMVYGGWIQGLWESATISANIKGSKVLDIVVKKLDDKSFCIGNELKVLNMLERMECMLYNANTFIALPNGLETLEEIFSIIYWVKLNFHQKYLGLLNVNGFYDDLLLFLDHVVEQGFIPRVVWHATMSASTAD